MQLARVASNISLNIFTFLETESRGVPVELTICIAAMEMVWEGAHIVKATAMDRIGESHQEARVPCPRPWWQ